LELCSTPVIYVFGASGTWTKAESAHAYDVVATAVIAGDVSSLDSHPDRDAGDFCVVSRGV